jgi:hypothetical protein
MQHINKFLEILNEIVFNLQKYIYIYIIYINVVEIRTIETLHKLDMIAGNEIIIN